LRPSCELQIFRRVDVDLAPGKGKLRDASKTDQTAPAAKFLQQRKEVVFAGLVLSSSIQAVAPARSAASIALTQSPRFDQDVS